MINLVVTGGDCHSDTGCGDEGRRVERVKRLRQKLPTRLFSVAAAFATKGAAAGLQFLQSVILGRYLGVEALGIYFFAISVYRISESAAPCGVTLSTVREVGAARATGSWATIRKLARQSVVFCIALGLIFGAVIWFGSSVIARAFEGEVHAEDAVRWMGLAIAPGCGAVALAAVLRGLGKQSTANILGSMVVPFVATLVFVLWTHDQSYLGAVIAFILAQFAALASLAFFVMWLTRGQSKLTDDGHSLFRGALPLWIVTLASLGNDSLGVVMLGLLGTPSDVGIFGVAVRLAMPLSFLGASIQAVYEPKFAGFYKTGNYADLHREFRTALRHSFILAGGMLVSMALLAEPLLLLFGPEFVSAKPAFLIILAGTCAMAAFGPSGSFMTMTHKAQYNAWVAIATLPMAGILLYILIPLYGGLGAAMGTSAALIVRTFAQAWAAEIHLREIRRRA